MKYVNNFSELLNDSHKGQSGMACFQKTDTVSITNSSKFMLNWAYEISNYLEDEIKHVDADILADEDSISEWMTEQIQNYLDSSLIYTADIFDLMREGYTGDQNPEDIFWQYGFDDFYDDLVGAIKFTPADYVKDASDDEDLEDEEV